MKNNGKGTSHIKKFKTISICISIVLIVLLFIAFLEYILLKILGFQYNSLMDLVLFFILYLFLEIPLSVLVNAIPKALKSAGIVHTSKKSLPFILNTVITFLLIEVIDIFMENININWQGTLIFALVTGLIGWNLNKDEDNEPPDIDSEDFNEIDNRFKS
ncbi:YrvL family regulatory protein [Cytobacillus sp. IB215316]|uniref:YrvL family regulatory protein n=1 Tax=Cytobacillus sp. IB215316 TaxID=3097354 RepID=UPI002A0D9552|nr:YrvL family regulatory protein [Cytobacillus sp. IB215316]MDX8363462.1 YrvL family regulatory protein [Cytobacillus sp. IB215316]